MTLEAFVAAYPKLYHMATADSLKSIETHGLLSTDRILTICQVEAGYADRLRSARRPEMTKINHEILGTFYLRDQKPMRDSALQACLDGMSIPDWYRLLNSRVFMWASRDRVDTLLGARAYRNKDQLVLTIDTKLMAARYFDKIEVSTLNSGATLYNPPRRGKQTFIPLSLFEAGRGTKPIVEVTVPGQIPDFRQFITVAEVRKAEAS